MYLKLFLTLLIGLLLIQPVFSAELLAGKSFLIVPENAIKIESGVIIPSDLNGMLLMVAPALLLLSHLNIRHKKLNPGSVMAYKKGGFQVPEITRKTVQGLSRHSVGGKKLL